MMNEAERLDYLKNNPMNNIKLLQKNCRVKSILTYEEVKMIFNPDKISQIWKNDIIFTANLLAASTGLRMGEIQALQPENIFIDYIHVCHSYDRKYGLKETKT